MALTPPYAHVKLNFLALGVKPWLNDFWFSVTGTFSGGWNVQNAAIALENHFKTNILAVMNTETQFIGTDLLVNNGGIVATASTYTTTSGALGTSATPIEVAAIVRMQSSAAGRSGHGRVFLSGLDSSLIDGGRIDSGSLTPFTTFATTCQTSVTDQGVTYHPAVYSRKNSILYNIQYCTVDLPLGTQRNRRTRR
jgi:hypothetical protein